MGSYMVYETPQVLRSYDLK